MTLHYTQGEFLYSTLKVDEDGGVEQEAWKAFVKEMEARNPNPPKYVTFELNPLQSAEGKETCKFFLRSILRKAKYVRNPILTADSVPKHRQSLRRQLSLNGQIGAHRRAYQARSQSPSGRSRTSNRAREQDTVVIENPLPKRYMSPERQVCE